MPSNTVWLDGIAENTTEDSLIEYFERFGNVNYCSLDRKKGRALIFYSDGEHAKNAVTAVKEASKKKIQVCYFAYI